MLPSEFEPAIPARERPQNHALDRAAKGIDYDLFIYLFIHVYIVTTGLETGFQPQSYPNGHLYFYLQNKISSFEMAY
jgi:hypothetical protein